MGGVTTRGTRTARRVGSRSASLLKEQGNVSIGDHAPKLGDQNERKGRKRGQQHDVSEQNHHDGSRHCERDDNEDAQAHGQVVDGQ